VCTGERHITISPILVGPPSFKQEIRQCSRLHSSIPASSLDIVQVPFAESRVRFLNHCVDQGLAGATLLRHRRQRVCYGPAWTSNTVRAWLGHVSLDTTNIYTEIDLEAKTKALAKCEITPAGLPNWHWRDDPELMTFLRAL